MAMAVLRVARQELVEPEEAEAGGAEEIAVDEEEQAGLQHGEAEGHEDAGGDVFYVDLHANGGGSVADDGLGDAADADGLAGEGVLEEADSGPGERAEDGVAAGDREEDDGNQREVEDEQPGKDARKRGLEEDEEEWDGEHDHRAEGVLGELVAGCVGAGRHKRQCF